MAIKLTPNGGSDSETSQSSPFTTEAILPLQLSSPPTETKSKSHGATTSLSPVLFRQRVTSILCDAAPRAETVCFALAMRKGLAPTIKDRRWRNLKVYKNCFKHSDAVAWAMEHDSVISKSDSFSTGGAAGTSAELVAVDCLNELINAGYVAHVANDHEFTAGEKHTLYFRFMDSVLDADNTLLHKHPSTDTKSNMEITLSGEGDDFYCRRLSKDIDEELAKLKTASGRMSNAIVSINHKLKEAHMKVLMLESAVASLGFALGFLVLTISVGIGGKQVLQSFSPYNRLQYNDDCVTIVGYVAISVLVILALLLWSRLRKRLELIIDGFALLAKLMNLMGDVDTILVQSDDSIALDDESNSDTEVDEDNDKKEENDDGTSPQYKHNQHLKRFSVREQMSRRIFGISEKLTSVPYKSARPLVFPTKTIVMREESDLPQPTKSWPHYPVLVCANTTAVPDMVVPKYNTGPCPVGTPFEFSTDLFEGSCLVRFRDVPSDDPEGDADYFYGRARCVQSVIQGRFKQKIRVSDVLTGQEFTRPFQHLPPSWIIRAGMSLIRSRAPDADIDICSSQPRAMSVLAATAKSISGDCPGNEPNITSHNLPDDSSVFGGYFKDGNIHFAKRKRHLLNRENAKLYAYDTESVYTFEFYQDLLHIGSYSIDLHITKIRLAKILNGQPIQIMCKTVDGNYLWSFQIWHEELLSSNNYKKNK